MIIAIIGKRDASARYLEIARRIGGILAQKGITVLNGLALGIDASALEGAVGANGKAIAVMPGGLDDIYPKRNRELAEKILLNGGCLISEYPQGTKPQRYTFVQRDRIQAMLSGKMLVVDAEKDGGTMQTVDYAVKYSKPLGCFAEKEGVKSPEGNQLLSRCLSNHNSIFNTPGRCVSRRSGRSTVRTPKDCVNCAGPEPRNSTLLTASSGLSDVMTAVFLWSGFITKAYR